MLAFRRDPIRIDVKGAQDFITEADRAVETYIRAIYQELQLSGENDINGRVKATLFYLEETQLRRSSNELLLRS